MKFLNPNLYDDSKRMLVKDLVSFSRMNWFAPGVCFHPVSIWWCSYLNHRKPKPFRQAHTYLHSQVKQGGDPAFIHFFILPPSPRHHCKSGSLSSPFEKRSSCPYFLPLQDPRRQGRFKQWTLVGPSSPFSVLRCIMVVSFLLRFWSCTGCSLVASCFSLIVGQMLRDGLKKTSFLLLLGASAFQSTSNHTVCCWVGVWLTAYVLVCVSVC